jgi:assimilatory nitrate reductase electron transfer subunit
MSSREQVVVVGAGMVGHRFVEELVRRDPAGRFAVHLVGAEDYAPYNRILLSDVVAGRCDLAALALPEPDPGRVSFHRGTTVRAVDRDAGTVELGDGRRLPFDHLVLATGAGAFVPPLPGLRDGMPRHAHVLRDLDDCRDVAARALNATHAVVLGGGLLGLEAACGLVRRGVRVTLVHVAGHLAESQLDAASAGVLAASLADLGVDVRTGTGVVEVVVEDGELHAVRLEDGLALPTDLLLVSCGVRPRTGLAATAGLRTDRGVVVDDDLRSVDDPRVHAIGDCAQPPEGGSGLVGPGWAQAARLAASLTGTAAPAPGSPPAVRLKAAGVDVVTMGSRGSTADPLRDRVVTVGDPVGRRHVELVVRGGRLAGVTCIGAPDLGSSLSVAYDRGTPLPVDPLALLLPERAEEDGSPALMPAATPVCRCNGVAKRDIVAAWDRGAATVPEVALATRATTGCGGCRDVVCGLVDWLRASDPATSQPATGDGERSVPGMQHDPACAEISAS